MIYFLYFTQKQKNVHILKHVRSELHVRASGRVLSLFGLRQISRPDKARTIGADNEYSPTTHAIIYVYVPIAIRLAAVVLTRLRVHS